jgi:hypothetical protein
MTTGKGHHVTSKQIIALQKFCEDECLFIATTHAGVIEYKAGWNDKVLADKFDITKNQVAKFRNDVYGALYVRTPEPLPLPTPSAVVSPEPDGIAGVIALMERCVDLEKCNQDLLNRVTLLERFAMRVATNSWTKLLNEAGRL